MKIPDEAVQAAATAMANNIGHGMTEKCVDNAKAALTAAAPYMQGVKVKELEWEGDCAVTPFGNYTHGEEDRGWRYIFHDYPFGMPCDEFYSSAEAAKAAAQADYEARISSAIEVSVREQALEEAAKLCDRGGAWDIADAIRALKSQPELTGGGE